MESARVFDEKDFLSCCGSTKFAKDMVLAGPFSSIQPAIDAARDIWFNKVDVHGWLEAFSAHPKIGETSAHKRATAASLSWSKGEQSTALATATDSTLQELSEWNARYREKFGIIFIIFASGRSTHEILEELKRRYENRPVVELENAAREQMKITELRLSKLFSVAADAASSAKLERATDIKKAGDRMSVIGAHFPVAGEASVAAPAQAPPRTRPPITSHVLDTALGSPACGIEVLLEFWVGDEPPSVFQQNPKGEWIAKARTMTDKDGRCGPMSTKDEIFHSGLYRISFNTDEKKELDVIIAVYKINLHCPQCAQDIRRPILRTPGVHTVDVKYEKNEVTVKGAIDAKNVHTRIQKWSKKKVEIISETKFVDKDKKDDKKKEIIKTIQMKVYIHCGECERNLRSRLLKHKGIHNVKTDIKAQSVTIEGVIEQEKLITYMRKTVHKYAEIIPPKEKIKVDEKKKPEETKVEIKVTEKIVEFKQVDKVGAKTKEGDTPYFVHFVYAPQLFSDENPNACTVM